MIENNDPSEIKTNYPSNSHKARDGRPPTRDEKNVEKVTTGEVVQRQKPLGRKIIDTFTGDSIHSVGRYVLFEVLIPAAKTMISDTLSQGSERLLWGDTHRSSSRQSRHTNYSNMYSSSRSEPKRDMSYRARASHDFNEIVLESRGEAEEVLDRLGDLVENYNQAAVSDLYDLVGITGNFTDDKWGWEDLRGASVTRVRNGWLLNLPRTINLV